jgi:protocatechuate 3,4-dioxygenase beta subunit
MKHSDDRSGTTRETRWRSGKVDLGRRRSLIGLTAASASLAGSGALAQAARCVLTEDAGEGPFYFDPELMRANIRDASAGLPLDIAIQVTRAVDCATLAAARVDLWHANGLGLYSGYEDQPGVGGISTAPAVGQTFLRGMQMTDRDGWVRFQTIYPSWYGGRTPHLHFKVWLGPEEVVASQIFFPDETSKFVFEGFDPYRAHVAKRTVFNDNDPIREGVYCEVERQGGDGVGASVVVAVADA